MNDGKSMFMKIRETVSHDDVLQYFEQHGVGSENVRELTSEVGRAEELAMINAEMPPISYLVSNGKYEFSIWPN